MISQIIKTFVYPAIILLIQVLILNNLNIGWGINPFLYLVILLTLPMDAPNYLVMPVGFFTGLLIDAFLNTIGVHASAGVLLAYARPYLLRYLAPRDGFDQGSRPVPSQFGMAWFVKYLVLAVSIHHIYLFVVEAFTFEAILLTLWRAIVSSLFTVGIIVISQFFSQTGK